MGDRVERHVVHDGCTELDEAGVTGWANRSYNAEWAMNAARISTLLTAIGTTRGIAVGDAVGRAAAVSCTNV
ncbi:MAG: hypothetical protein M3069_20895 [Chloroflexota bacterium]|nr:hypothetical protein [Chloroflexota bacterium]